MSIFELSAENNHTVNLLSDIGDQGSGSDRSEEELLTIFSRFVWSILAEPGDSTAGAFVASLGPVRALEALIKFRADLPALLRSLSNTEGEQLRTQLGDEVLYKGIDRWLPRLSQTRSLEMLQRASLIRAKLLTPASEFWPQGLVSLDIHQPQVLWARGRLDQLSRLNHSVALVGSRAASAYGEHIVMELATGIDNHGLEVLSGGAYGIDGMAHRAALANDGSTTAILAGGIDQLYPSGHEKLFTRILDHGLILAESSPGTTPTRWRFLQRNRLIAAIALGTVVIEAGFRSGSLNTAAHTSALGKPLGAVPGPITSATSAGCHRLIREYGAECITGTDDVLALLGFGSQETAREIPGLIDKDELRVLDAVSSSTPRSPEAIAASAGFSVSHLQSLLGLMELKNLVERRGELWLKAG